MLNTAVLLNIFEESEIIFLGFFDKVQKNSIYFQLFIK